MSYSLCALISQQSIHPTMSSVWMVSPSYQYSCCNYLRSLIPLLMMLYFSKLDYLMYRWIVALLKPFGALKPPLGIFFSTGNHEEFTSRNKFLDAIGRTGIRVLNNEKVDVDGLQIVGVHDGEAGEPDRQRRIWIRDDLGQHSGQALHHGGMGREQQAAD